MASTALLASDGCDRATAYHMSNKVVRHPDGVFVTWLDENYQSILAQINPHSGQVLQAFPLAKGVDNHCGATMAVGPDNTLHVVCGAHAMTGFVYRYSKSPADPDSWSVPEGVGASPTYPSMVVLSDGTLLLAYRHTNLTGGKWGAFIQKRTPDGRWQWPYMIMEAPAHGYSYPTNSLRLDTNGVVHLGFEFYKTYHENCESPKGLAFSHLYSPDQGTKWYHDDDRLVSRVPVGIEDANLIDSNPKGNMRPGNVLTLSDGRIVFGVVNYESGTMTLYLRKTPGEWDTFDLTGHVIGREGNSKCTSCGRLSICENGELVLVTTVAPEQEWAHPQQHVRCVWFDPKTDSVTRTYSIPKEDPGQANWLASVEHWHCDVPDQPPILLFTDGNRGETCNNDAACKVRMLSLDKNLGD